MTLEHPWIGIVVAVVGYGAIAALIVWNWRLRKKQIRELVAEIRNRKRIIRLVEDPAN